MKQKSNRKNREENQVGKKGRRSEEESEWKEKGKGRRKERTHGFCTLPFELFEL